MCKRLKLRGGYLWVRRVEEGRDEWQAALLLDAEGKGGSILCMSHN